MKIPIADDSPIHRAGLSYCAPSFDPEHIRSVVTKLYKANLLRLRKCDEFQGYLFSRPVPVEQIEILLHQNKSPLK